MSFVEKLWNLIRTLRAQGVLLESADRLENALEADDIDLPWLLAPAELNLQEKRILSLRLELMRICHEAKTAGLSEILALAEKARAHYPFAEEVVEVNLTHGPDDRSRRLGIAQLPSFSNN